MKIKTTTIRKIKDSDLENFVMVINKTLQLMGTNHKIDYEEFKKTKKTSYEDINDETTVKTTIEIIK